MEMKFKKLKNADGEITYLFAAIILSFFIIIYVCFIIITANYFNMEYFTREISNRISIKSLKTSQNLINVDNIKKEFEYELEILKNGINSKINKKILEETFTKDNLQIIELKDLQVHKNIKVFEVKFNPKESYRIGGIINYKPKTLAYVFITLNEEIQKR